MAGSKGSIPYVIRPTRSQGGGLKARYGKSGASTGQNRRVLCEINQNIITASTTYPYVVGLSGKKPMATKKQLVPVRRPVTRKFVFGYNELNHLWVVVSAVQLVHKTPANHHCPYLRNKNEAKMC